MNYRERREARADRLRGWADKRDAKAQLAHDKAVELADAVPFGQPILVGHHSESRSRSIRDKIHNGMVSSVENSAKAEEMRQKADNIEAAAKRAIYDDDPDAVQRLTDRLAVAEMRRTQIKMYNASARKGAPDDSLLDASLQKSLRELQGMQGMMRPDGQFPSFYTTNLSGSINRLKMRIVRLTSFNED